jgi:AcrR family transcriptional regulator
MRIVRHDPTGQTRTTEGAMSDERYHHGDLREALIQAAIELVALQGADRFSMREASRMAGVSSGAPYRHFPDNDALLRATARRVSALLSEAQQAAVARLEEPALRLRAIGIAGVRFAVEHPELFRLLNDPRWIDREDPETRDQLQANEDAVQTVLHASVRGGVLRGEHDPALVLLAAQATTYGLARLFLDGHLASEGVDPDEAERVAGAVLDLLGTGILSRTLVDGGGQD